MTRLIDADARVTVQSYDDEHEEYCHDVMTIEQALDFATDEGCPPTIDAIPVEWIMKWSNKQYRKTQKDVSIVDVLAAWQKEQGV